MRGWSSRTGRDSDTSRDECVGNSVDHDTCVDSCKDWADENEGNADRLDACQECVDDRSCTESAFGCIAECAFIPTSLR